MEIADLKTRDDVILEEATEANACGAFGCNRSTRLLRVVIVGIEARVLCPDHALDLIGRKLDLEGLA